MIRKFLVWKHHSEDLYISGLNHRSSPTRRILTTDVKNKAYWFGNEDEAKKWIPYIPVPLAWDLVVVDYDTMTGAVVN